MKKSNFALRLQMSLMEEARKVAKAEGVAVNQLINVAVAEKVSAARGQFILGRDGVVYTCDRGNARADEAACGLVLPLHVPGR